MTKKEFLQELQRSLAGKMDSGQIAEHVEYYSEYIEIAVRKGEEEEAVVQQLGSPRLLAKNLADAAEYIPQKAVFLNIWKRLKDWFANL